MNLIFSFYGIRYLRTFCLSCFIPLVLLSEEREYIAMIPPFHDRQNIAGTNGPLQLNNQRFVVFVYKNAVAVYSEADFVNTSMEAYIQEFALPSTGHDENDIAPGGRISTGIFSIQLWLQGERIIPEFINNGREDWYVIRTQFAPGEQKKVKALFWAQTSPVNIDPSPGLDTAVISDGNRGFMFDLAHAAIWNGPIETISIKIILMQGLDVKQGSFNIDPQTYEAQDSTLSWKFNYIEPSSSDNISVLYSSVGKQGTEYNTMAKLSTYIVKNVYDLLRDYVRKMDEE